MPVQKIFVAKTSELAPLQMKKFKLGFRSALIVNTGTALRAYYDFCTHQGGALKMKEGKFECLRHFSTFDVATGARLAGQAPEGSKLTNLPIIVEGDDVFIEWQMPE